MTPTTNEPEEGRPPEKDGLEQYCTLPRGGWRIALVAFALALILWMLGWSGLLPPVSMPIRGLLAGNDWLDNLSRLTFLLYLCALAAMWIVYLFSGRQGMQVQTLRQLLLLNSVSWAARCAPEDTEFHIRETREKARTTITVAAILVAASALVISQINTIHVAMEAAAEAAPVNAALLSWQRFLLAMGYICATGAFVALIISVDALDCLFNHFADGKEKRRNPTALVRYFYKFTINPKYIGLFLLLTSVVFVLAYFNANIGSLALAIILTLGYAHWFPLGRLTPEGEPSLGGHTLRFWGICAVLYAAPGYLLIKPFLSQT